MKVYKLEDKCYAYSVWGRVGRGAGYANFFYGDYEYGTFSEGAAIYQRRFVKKLKKQGMQIVKMKFYHPIDPKTPNQLVTRQNLRNAVNSYKSLVNQGKLGSLKMLKFRGKKGYLAYISAFMRNDPVISQFTS